jgi:hypothetical protein
LELPFFGAAFDPVTIKMYSALARHALQFIFITMRPSSLLLESVALSLFALIATQFLLLRRTRSQL